MTDFKYPPGYKPMKLDEYATIFMKWYGNRRIADESWVATIEQAVLSRLKLSTAEREALVEALRELEFCARKLRHSAETGTERRKDLERIDAAIKEAARLTGGKA